MRDDFGKRQAHVSATLWKRINVLEDSHSLATLASGSNSTITVVGGRTQSNYREQPVADSEDSFAKTVPTPLKYCSELPFQPEELFPT